MINLLYSLFLFFGLIPFLIKNFSLQRLGFCLPNIKPGIWIHCASLGEVAGIKPFIDEIRKAKNLSIIISVITKTGYLVAKGFKEEVIYLPVDFSFIIRRALKKLSPKILIISETELWPNLIREAKKQEIKIVLINGRISEKSKRRYKRVFSLMRDVVSCFDLFLMQTIDDKNRIRELGVKNDRIFITGNTKFDWLFKDIPDINLGFKDKDIIVFGSIREKEEDIILRCAKTLIDKKIAVIIASRHIERAAVIVKKAEAIGLSLVRRTEMIKTQNSKLLRDTSYSKTQNYYILLDTIGELRGAYKMAKIAFVGGSLFPYGCHNLIEPAILGKPVLFGRYTDNFKDVAFKLKEMGGGFEVVSENELIDKILYLLKSPNELKIVGKNAKNIALSLMGASKRCSSFILKLI